MAVKSGDTLYAYIYLDPDHPPQEVMLQWHDGDWHQRAYWGQNLINWGTNGTSSRRYMGRLPASGGWVRLEVPAAQVGLAGKTVNGLALTLYGGRAWWDRAGVRRAVHEVTKYYEFNGQRIARHQDGVLTYLHTDHLGSTLLATNSSGTMVGEHRYRAYGSSRGGDELATDHRFTGQKLDGTGLYYYNARYYDPALGAFIGCPLGANTIVPRPGGSRTTLLDYNRYMYVRGRPLTMNDPSGHCVNSTTTSQPEEISYDNNECWRLANTIGAMWDSTDYWSNRFTSREVFVNNVANNGHNGTDFFQGQLDNFFSSDEGKMWLEPYLRDNPPSVDWSDYIAITYGYGFATAAGIAEVSLIVDQNWNIYLRGGTGPNIRGFSISNGHVLINTDPEGSLFRKRMPIDQLNISETERVQLLQNALTGRSASASGLGAGASIGLEPPYHVTVEEVAGAPGASVNPWSYTFRLR